MGIIWVRFLVQKHCKIKTPRQNARFAAGKSRKKRRLHRHTFAAIKPVALACGPSLLSDGPLLDFKTSGLSSSRAPSTSDLCNSPSALDLYDCNFDFKIYDYSIRSSRISISLVLPPSVFGCVFNFGNLRIFFFYIFDSLISL